MRKRLPTPFPRKRFGQHFLEPAWVEKVIRAIEPRSPETFVEIGPGRGALTRPLVSRAKHVVAVEIDRDLADALRATAPPNLTVVEGDFLEVPTDDLRRGTGDWRLLGTGIAVRAAGNLPYNVASPILFKLVELYSRGVPLVDATVMLQREVAGRLVAAPGSRDYGVLSILIRHSADVELLLKLPPGAFRPPPRVNSALVRLRFHPPDPPVKDPLTFAGIVQAVFTRRRKTLANALLAYGGRVSVPAPADILRLAGLDGRRRPETLTIAEFARLADVYASISP
jgi:16S rRNA (adenine1518-N6/adenine1519-N6)-dimethyltransferase